MRSMILIGCLWMLSLATYAQNYDRVRSGTPLRWGMNGSIEILDGDLAQYYGHADTAIAYRGSSTASTPFEGNPYATRFASTQALCANSSVQLNWVAVQHAGADRYEIEQSSDGQNWVVIGVVPAMRNQFGEASYSFNYNKDARNVLFRIKSVNIAEEQVFSSSFESPCSNTAYLSVTPNPVYSTTTVRVGSPSTAKVKLTMLDSKGMVVHNSDATLTRGTNHLPLDMSSLPRGYYTLAIRWINGKQEVLELVKQ